MFTKKTHFTVHIISHGNPGCLYLGKKQLNLENIEEYAPLIRDWQAENIFIYGCRVACGDPGTEFIEKLHKLTGANIAASTTLTGNSTKGGNWELEVTKGDIKNISIFSEIVKNNYAGVLQDFVVNTLVDENDGVERQDISLRDAINAANFSPGADTITFDSSIEDETSCKSVLWYNKKLFIFVVATTFERARESEIQKGSPL